MPASMMIAVAGATGRVGSRVVELLEASGHDVVPMSRFPGVDVVTGDGLTEALTGVECVIDTASGTARGPRQAPRAAGEFFTAYHPQPARDRPEGGCAANGRSVGDRHRPLHRRSGRSKSRRRSCQRSQSRRGRTIVSTNTPGCYVRAPRSEPAQTTRSSQDRPVESLTRRSSRDIQERRAPGARGRRARALSPVCHPDSATRTFCTPPLLSRRVHRGQSERVTESAWRAHRADVIADGRFRSVPGGVTSPPEGLLPELVRSATRVRE
jgi:hypothetical protein